jgi:hypothetical protein
MHVTHIGSTDRRLRYSAALLSQKLIRGPYFCFFFSPASHDAALRLVGDGTQRPLRHNRLVTPPFPAACATTTLEEGRSSNPAFHLLLSLSLYITRYNTNFTLATNPLSMPTKEHRDATN